DLSQHQNILREVVRGIENADIVLADLTTLNANVLYELGIAHTMNKHTILLVQEIDEIPFDLRPYAVIPYSEKFDKAFELGDSLCSIITQFLQGNYSFSNPVNDFRTQHDGKSTPIINQALKISSVDVTQSDT